MTMWCGVRKKGVAHSDEVIRVGWKSEMPSKWVAKGEGKDHQVI